MKEGIAQWRRGVLTVCALVSGWSGLGWIPGQRRAVFLGGRYTFTVPPLLRCINGMGAGEFIAGGNLSMD